MSSEIDRLRRDFPLAQVASRFLADLAEDGDEWAACCPFHREDTASFTIFVGDDNVQRFHCFGCGERGDVVDFVKGIKGVDTREAIRILGGADAGPNVAPKQVKARNIYDGYTPLDPPHEIDPDARITIYNPKRGNTGSFVPALTHPYRRADGSLIGYVLRHALPNGKKETPSVLWVRRPNGAECWSRFPFPKPRPLYGLDRLGDARQVIVVEGEKCRDALAAVTFRTVVSWIGGTQGVKHTDWSPLAGRNVVIWPDADAPGIATGNEIAAIVTKLDCNVRVMDVSGAPKEDWDCADAIDAGWDRARLDTFMRERVRPWVKPAARSTEKPVERPEPLAGPSLPPTPATPVVEARTVQQEQTATVTQLATRRTVAADASWELGLVCNAEGNLKPNATKNWALFLENHRAMAGVFAFDAFKMRVMLMRRPPWMDRGSHWEPRGIQDRDYSETVMWLEAFSMTPKASNIAAVIQTVAERSSFDRLREYLEGGVWDGKPRVRRFANDYLGCLGDNYAPVVSERWLISSVARGLVPGCKVDTMPILEGPQGLLKSTALRALYGAEFFTDNISDIGSKDAKMEMQGVWGLEIAEMHKISNAEVNEVKKFLTQQVDRFRPPYGRSVIEAPRRVVLNGTINPEGNAYLRDPTGARRFWPLECRRIDIAAIERDRDQLWAEAVHLFKSGAPWWVQDDEQAAVEVEQERRTDVDVWVDIITPALKSRRSIAQGEIFSLLGIQSRDADWRHAGRVGRIMKKLGWTAGRDRRDGQDRAVFKAPDDGQEAFGDW